MPRLTIILEQGESRAFEAFDREAQFQESAGKSLETLLEEFQEERGDDVDAEDVSRSPVITLPPAPDLSGEAETKAYQEGRGHRRSKAFCHTARPYLVRIGAAMVLASIECREAGCYFLRFAAARGGAN